MNQVLYAGGSLPLCRNRLVRASTLAICIMVGVCVAPSALAQSSISFNGLLDLSLGSIKSPGDERSQTNVSSGSMTTSWFGLRGAEDLGGGLSVIFQLESFIRADTGEQGRFAGDAFWSRNSFVGFSSTDWGRL